MMQNHKDKEINFREKSDFVPDISECDITNICDELKIEIKHEPVENCWDVLGVNVEFDEKESNFKKIEIELKNAGRVKTEPGDGMVSQDVLSKSDVCKLNGANADLKVVVNQGTMDGNCSTIHSNNNFDKEKVQNKNKGITIKKENHFISDTRDSKYTQVGLLKSGLDDFNIANLKEEIQIEIKHEAVEGEGEDVCNGQEFSKEDSQYKNNVLEIIPKHQVHAESGKSNFDCKFLQKSHQCNYCTKAFICNDEQLFHMKGKCSECNSSLIKPLKTHTGENPYQCSDCNRSFTNKCNLIQVKRANSGEKPHQCSNSDKTFVRKDQLIKQPIDHIEEEDNIELSKNDFTHEDLKKACKDGVFNAKVDHFKIEIKPKPVVCDWNIKSTESKFDEETCKNINQNIELKQENHYDAELNKFLFVPCDLKKQRINYLKFPNGNEGDEINIKQEPLECYDWKEACMVKSNDIEITPYINGDISIKQERNVKAELAEIDIGKSGLDKALFEYNKDAIEINTELLKSQSNVIYDKDMIEICGGNFWVEDVENASQKVNQYNEESMASIMVNSIENDKEEYSNEKIKQSKKCNKFGTDSDKLINHVEANIGETLYHCTQCAKVFKSVVSQRKHVKTHIPDKPYQCIDCGMSFLQKFKLRKHQMIHTKEKPYQCTHCNKSFTRDDNLKLHLITHVGVKSHQNSYSKPLFSDNSDFRQNLKKQTSDYPNISQFDPTFTEKDQVLGNLKTHTNNRIYPCNHCDRSYLGIDKLKIHLKTHTEEKPFKCSKCDKTFAVNHHLQRHLKMKIHDKEYSKNNDLRCPQKTLSIKAAKNSRAKDEKSCLVKQDEDCQIIYIGCITDGTTSEIRERFRKFGTIKDISVTFRGQRNNYGFITFKDHIEANQAIEYGNDDMSYPQYYICSKKKYEEDKLLVQAGDHQVIYIGCIAEGTSKAELRDRFSKFGTIRDISMIFRGQRNNYSRIRFARHIEALNAIKYGNDVTKLPYYYLCLRGHIKYEEDEFLKKQEEAHHIIYISCIAEGTTKDEIRDRFSKFGSIIDISLIFRGQRNNYGFITYSNQYEAYKAITHGNDHNSLPQYYISSRKRYDEDKLFEQADDPRVIYIGCITDGTSNAELRDRFSKFGQISNISIIFKGKRNNYAHIKFKSRHDAYTAIEHGNDDTSLPHYYLCLEGTRKHEEDEFIKKQGEDRKVIYITDITEETTNFDLRDRFGKFGTITYISLISNGLENIFSFIAFSNYDEAYKATKHGNDDTSLPQYYISLGGRRVFCKRGYSDLDAQNVVDTGLVGCSGLSETSDISMDFDDLLKAAMKKIR